METVLVEMLLVGENKFKIDFIVWKQIRRIEMFERCYRFKIDFIVWKHLKQDEILIVSFSLKLTL